jgi:branched-chain amino acid transport system substrate-binding protein
MTLAKVLLVAGVIVGAGIGNYAAPQTPGGAVTVTVTGTGSVVKEAPLKGATVKFGYIASSTTGLETGKPYHEQIIAPGLNDYAELMGYDVSFEYLIDDATGQAQVHLEKVQGFKSTGVTIVEGGGWSSQAQAALSYCNSNEVLLWSSSSTSPTLAIADDYLYRMCTADTALAPALANVMWAAGVKSIVIFQRGDSWGDGIVNLLVPIWTAKGGNVAGDIVRYAAESTEFSNYLTIADQTVGTAVTANGGESQRVGVVILSFDEVPVILKQASSYDNIYNVHWWGSDGTAKSQRAMDDAPDEANHIGIYSLLSREDATSRFLDIQARYIALTSQQFSTYSAYSYDIGWVLSTSVMQAQSQAGKDILDMQAPICLNTFGVAGWSRLDEFGDRFAPPYDVWGFFDGNNAGSPDQNKASVSIIMAQYDPDSQTTVFDTTVLGYTPIGP